MVRAKRHYIHGYAWHITHRCHKREFLLKFPRDRRRWIEWFCQARKRYPGLSVLDYMVASNHIHTYIDLNMVRAGVAEHPCEWEFCGYNEIQNPRKRKRIIDFDRLMEWLGFENHADLKDAHFKWVESQLQAGSGETESKWTQSIAVGSKSL
jgi:putative transposase